MKLDGIHHITAITADAIRNVNFYAGALALRMVKKTVNQDDPTVYHLFYADEVGSPGSDITFFEYPNAVRGQAGAGFVHRVTFRVGSHDALEFWKDRLSATGMAVNAESNSIVFADPEGLHLELKVVQTSDKPLIARHPDIEERFAIHGFDGVRAFSSDPEASTALLAGAMGFESRAPDGYEVRGPNRGGLYAYDLSSESGRQGAGTVHHIAWASAIEDHPAWRQTVADAGAQVTPVIDRFYFKSIYFREPSGVLFEIATLGPGFAADEDIEHLGEALSLPPNFEHLREELKQVLTPLPDPRSRV